MIQITNKHDLVNVLFVLTAAMDPKAKAGSPALKCVLIDADGTMVCTDGHRLHTAKTEYTPGLYDIIKKTRTDVVLAPSSQYPKTFPDYRRVIPATDGKEPIVTIEPGDPAWKTYTRFNRATTGTTLDYAYFSDAVTTTEEIYWTAPNDTVVFKGPMTLAVVMPCRF